jgi:hypothetical protein
VSQAGSGKTHQGQTPAAFDNYAADGWFMVDNLAQRDKQKPPVALYALWHYRLQDNATYIKNKDTGVTQLWNAKKKRT